MIVLLRVRACYWAVRADTVDTLLKNASTELSDVAIYSSCGVFQHTSFKIS